MAAPTVLARPTELLPGARVRLEIYSYYTGWKWERGKADNEDWKPRGPPLDR